MHCGIVRPTGIASASPALAMTVAALFFAVLPTRSIPRVQVSRVSVVTGPMTYAGKPRPGDPERCENLYKHPYLSPCYCAGGKCHCCPPAR